MIRKKRYFIFLILLLPFLGGSCQASALTHCYFSMSKQTAKGNKNLMREIWKAVKKGAKEYLEDLFQEKAKEYAENMVQNEEQTPEKLQCLKNLPTRIQQRLSR